MSKKSPKYKTFGELPGVYTNSTANKEAEIQQYTDEQILYFQKQELEAKKEKMLIDRTYFIEKYRGDSSKIKLFIDIQNYQFEEYTQLLNEQNQERLVLQQEHDKLLGPLWKEMYEQRIQQLAG